ncbi:MAG TPA: hypothetical protein VJW75_02335 [Candidatus Eisenbacteria bacterium]|nr:hypothetical protein [Candidatus Eisenbacteria bacterium]
MNGTRIVTAAALWGAISMTGIASAEKPANSADAPADSGYTIKGGADRTDLKSLTVEGEDRVHVSIDRPVLALNLNPETVTGLEFGSARDVLDRVPPDLTTTFLGISSDSRSPYPGRPWLRQFATGSVARFQPAVRGTERWKLTVADSRGQTVALFEGKGEPPKEIVWDGRSVSGAPVAPGITYSYVFEAVDKAGNKRNFVGEGFRVSAYRLESPAGPVLVFSGQQLAADMNAARAYGAGAPAATGAGANRVVAPLLLEAASWLNQSSRVSQPMRVTASARSYEQANALAKQVGSAMSDLTIGDPARVQSMAEVVPDAPEGGVVRIAVGVAPGAAVPVVTPVATGNAKDAAKKVSKENSKGKK